VGASSFLEPVDTSRFRVKKEAEKFCLEEMEGGMILRRFVMRKDQWVLLARDMLVVASANDK